jgi:excinuclease ABC subunit C
MNESWKHNVKNAPRVPGVYIMKDGSGKVIYVGKAKDLRSRLRAYMNRTDTRFMIPFLTSKIETVEVIVTETEKEALILENNLIKEHRPRYNVFFRDDKNYFSIKIDLQKNPFPRFQLVRQMKKDGARYFGPYPSGNAAKETLNFLQSIFPLRTCHDRAFKNHSRPCLDYQIKRCLAPCAGLVDGSVYGRMVSNSIAFLEGNRNGLLADLSSRMKAAAEDLNFEEAGILRDRIGALNMTLEKQMIISAKFKDQDIFGLYREGNQTQAFVLHIRKGRLLGKNAFPLVTLETESEEILSSLITQYYDGNIDIPAEIILPFPLEDGAVIAEWLTDKRGKKVSLITPQKGRSMDLLMMANSNAGSLFKTEQLGKENAEAAIKQLKEKLSLKNIPRTIECFDISNVSGKYAVGSQATFVNGRPWKEGYRRYRIKTLADMDDYGMMREVLERRYKKNESLPDLVVVDGGKGQLGIAAALFKDLGIENVDIIALAKERRIVQPSALNRTEDRVYLYRRKEPVYIARFPAAHFLLQQIRDEAHRFAISYHRRLKEKRDFHSILDDIPSIGESRKKDLLSRFGDIKKIMDASAEDLQSVEGIGKKLSIQIHDFLKKA